MNARERALALASAAANKNAKDVIVLDMQELATFTDFFVIASGTSSRQARTIADFAIERARDFEERPQSVEGERVGRWILIDFGDVVVHVLQNEARSFYDLERLWSEAKRVEIPRLEEAAL